MRVLDQVLSRIWGFGATWRFAKLGIRVTTRGAVPLLVTRILTASSRVRVGRLTQPPSGTLTQSDSKSLQSSLTAMR